MPRHLGERGQAEIADAIFWAKTEHRFHVLCGLVSAEARKTIARESHAIAATQSQFSQTTTKTSNMTKTTYDR
jgi:hypothetical protein